MVIFFLVDQTELLKVMLPKASITGTGSAECDPVPTREFIIRSHRIVIGIGSVLGGSK